MNQESIDIDYNTNRNIVLLYLYLGIKRFFDIIFSLIGLVFLLPLMLIIKIANVINKDFNPIIYSQDRIGKNGKIFKFYKFRSMVPNADQLLSEILEKDEQLAQEYKINKKLKNDPRITKIGKVLRKTSLDELPQLINIFLGQMSFVGNRPYMLIEKEDMKDYYNSIVKSKPGLTGLWQVMGRSDITFDERCKIEAKYSSEMSLSLDIKIFFKTFLVVLKGL